MIKRGLRGSQSYHGTAGHSERAGLVKPSCNRWEQPQRTGAVAVHLTSSTWAQRKWYALRHCTRFSMSCDDSRSVSTRQRSDGRAKASRRRLQLVLLRANRRPHGPQRLSETRASLNKSQKNTAADFSGRSRRADRWDPRSDLTCPTPSRPLVAASRSVEPAP